MNSNNSCRSWHRAQGLWEVEGDRSDGGGRNHRDDRTVPVWDLRESPNVSVIGRSKERRRMGFS